MPYGINPLPISPYLLQCGLWRSLYKDVRIRLRSTNKKYHWGRVTHICVSKLTIIGSDNGLSPGRRHAIIWTNARILLIDSNLRNKLQWNPRRNSFIFIIENVFENVVCEMASIWSRPQCVNQGVETSQRMFKMRPGAHFWVARSFEAFESGHWAIAFPLFYSLLLPENDWRALRFVLGGTCRWVRAKRMQCISNGVTSFLR